MKNEDSPTDVQMQVRKPVQLEPHIAAIDLGSQTCRILIARLLKDRYKVVDSLARIVQLGSGLLETGRLSHESMDRALNALDECSRKLNKYNIVGLRSVATEACRQASNTPVFLMDVLSKTRIDLEVIPEFEEGQLALLGCWEHIDINIPYVLGFDIGGCSTEVMWARVKDPLMPEVLDWMSIPYGVVNLIEACGGDPGLFYEDIRQKIGSALSKLNLHQEITSLIEQGKVQMIGSSGTTTTVAAIHLDLPYYNRSKVDGSSLPLVRIHEIGRRLQQMSLRELAYTACIGPSRSELVLAGMAILESICDCWPVQHLKVADRGVRDGILQQLSAEYRNRQEEAVVWKV